MRRGPSKVLPSIYDPEDAKSLYPGYMVRVEDASQKRAYHYALKGSHEMCWCFHRWRASVFATK